MTTRPEPLWSGRLEQGLDPQVFDFSVLVERDRRLLPYDLKASMVHVRMLERQGLLAERDALALQEALAELEFAPDGDEDIHAMIERVLVERLGELGKRVHAGRSRNDQTAVATRLWARDAAGQAASAVGALARTLVDRARGDGDLVLPGYTHLQRAQPITLGHHLAAHATALLRDISRFGAAGEAAAVSPLGAGALAGSSLGLDPEFSARELGMTASFENSLDAVSDRDFLLDLCYAATVTMVHLSRMAEELVLWTSQEFAFAELADSVATGSSMMPQKKNPDVAELVRGRAGVAIGRLTGLLALNKGIPLSYNRDLQDTRPQAYEQIDAVCESAEVFALAYATLRFDAETMRAAADDGRTVATDVAERLVVGGSTFRDAHHAVAARVARGERFTSPTVEEAVAARDARGMPATYREQLDRIEDRLAGLVP
ncbi:argininosuccinate lyase [Streptomyces sp. NRRL F-5126]|uniref:argininosuccinate lyase n=1 Tax=Streptomyces sp. NRRL F-5126 TaxID=1463857 RepID=UPI00056B36DC|nr:argininosuccinate lyase [Streptomyces sp. NRRL F-5126]